MEDMYGGKWGVLIITDTRTVSSKVHWTIPSVRTKEGTLAFCLHVYDGVQYDIFQTSDIDSLSRVTIDDVLKNSTSTSGKQRPEKISVEEFERITGD
ncbi:unnamed protein product [Toxocara canis]|uniref:MULE domain-containing protein n=1 Tax=Toxocara canis TaxID=6265 RepID=A0A183VAZ7_TOXCA|nr:unnamed protein product [Toxocara canis]